MLTHIRQWARQMKREVIALYLSARDSRTPWYAKVLAAAVTAYALSPIDLIPDFIPVLGLLDDLLIVPAGLWVAVRLIPPEVLQDCRQRAEHLATRPVSRRAAVIVVLIWLATLAMAGRLLWPPEP